MHTDHLGTKNASLFLLEELEDLVGVTAVDIGFGHHRESYTVVLPTHTKKKAKGALCQSAA